MTLSTDAGGLSQSYRTALQKRLRTRTTNGLTTKRKVNVKKILDEMRNDPDPVWLQLIGYPICLLGLLVMVML